MICNDLWVGVTRGGRGSSCLKWKKIGRTCFLVSLSVIASHPSYRRAWALGSFDSREWTTLRIHTSHNLWPGCERLRSWQLDMGQQGNGKFQEGMDSSGLYPLLLRLEHGQSSVSPAKCAPLLSKQKGEARLIHLHTASQLWRCALANTFMICFPNKSPGTLKGTAELA